MPPISDLDTTLEAPQIEKKVISLREHVVEIVSDAGEGAQKAGQSFGTLSAKMGNGIWTVEIIPAEIQPPPRNAAGASGIRIRVGATPVTNMGDEIDLIVAFNEQVLLGRLRLAQFKPNSVILLEDKWRKHRNPAIVAEYTEVYDKLIAKGYQVYEIPMEDECKKYVGNPRLGKNMFVLGLLSSLYSRDMEMAQEIVAFTFRKKPQKVIDDNLTLLQAGYAWAEDHFDFRFEVPPTGDVEPKIVINGNQALALGVMASGMEVCAMYPITPATSASHYLSDIFENVGGMVHQAEDEIAACGVAIGTSYAGKCAVTITSGPGMSLKTELLGLAVMAEIPLVLINVQRGGPSTGLPTKVEQGDLLATIFSTHGDAPKIVMAPSTIEDCFYDVLEARKLAETYRMPVMLLSDANLATGQQPFTRPTFDDTWVAPPIDQSPLPEGASPYDWDPETGLSKRFIPGQKGGMHTLTGLAHTSEAQVAYNPEVNVQGMRNRSLKLAKFQQTLLPPTVFGDPDGDLLLIGWGSTRGAIEEAVARAQADGLRVSSVHLKYLQPMASGIKEILQRFKKVITVEINYGDDLAEDLITADNQRYANLALLLRARYLIDVQSWTSVRGQPIKPVFIEDHIRKQLSER